MIQSIAAHSDHFVSCLSVGLSVFVCLSGSHTFLVVTHRYVSQATHAFLGMLPFWYFINFRSTVKHLFFARPYTGMCKTTSMDIYSLKSVMLSSIFDL